MGTPKLDYRSEEFSESESTGMAAPDEPNQVHVNRVLWILFGLSVVFLAAVQVYVGRVQQAIDVEQSTLADQAILTTQGPLISVVPQDLWLTWTPAVGTTQYQLRIHSDRGIPVVDPVVVFRTEWRPSEAVIPGLTPGRYRWTVEARDSSGQILAESASQMFSIQ